ncbi:hypothetical protein GE09DRAFT_714478 [Coniochaeta sp. 2T2.1]|nr:hypothetical protein GE09DRAFT_714478 [Coniochaeta sp. 2T2.1]
MSAALSHRFASLDGKLSGSFPQHNTAQSNQGQTIPVFSTGSLPPDTLGVSISADNAMTSHEEVDGLQYEIHSCPHCEKQFGRMCDLNKHAKSHSRPFKCQFNHCKYNSKGWPTAKELERHVNDKHSATPQTYPCLFQHCSYSSKRESNCKQHMEKTHGWRYIRSKSNGRRVSRRVGAQLAALQTFLPSPASQSVNPQSSSLKHSPHPADNDDFVLFPHDGDHAPSDDEYDNDGFMDIDDRGSEGSDMVIPWTSPDTRLRRRETFLQNFTRKFNSHEADLPIDPQLSSMGALRPFPETNTTCQGSSLSPRTNYPAGSRPNAPLEVTHDTATNTRSLPNTPLTLALQQRPAGSVPPSHHGRSSSLNMRQSAAAASMRHAVPRLLTTLKRREEDDPQDEHPQKRFKPSPKLDFKDNQMPDIFVAAYPEVYNRNTKPLYSSCETEHKDISTLVRHLGRAPHRLRVSERCIDSFDVNPEELFHVKRGVCRRCWEVFTDHEAFQSHISTECEKTSKGKREKWRILHDSFTPLATDFTTPTQQPVTPGLPLPHHQPWTTGIAGAGAHDDEDDSPNAAPSPTAVELGPRVPLEPEVDAELEKLRRENRQLKAFARVVLKQAKGVIDLSRLVAIPSLLEAIEGGTEFGPGSNVPQLGRLTFHGNESLEDGAPDPASLVGHMNSQPTDVDAQGMMDDIQQTLSRTSSGMSGSDRSTIRHVSNSPRQGFEPYPGDSSRTPQQRTVKSHGGPTPMRHQPTSLPDSGYGSDKKKSSIADANFSQAKQAFPEVRPETVPVPQYHAAVPVSNMPGMPSNVPDPSQQPEYPVDLQLEPLMGSLPPQALTAQDVEEAYFMSSEFMEQFDEYGNSHSQSSSSFPSNHP